MRVGKKSPPTPTKREPRKLVASSAMVPFANTWDSPRAQREWQREVWRLMEIVGEARYVVSGFGSAVSRARYYMADIDTDGSIKGESTNKTAIKVFARSLASGILAEEELRILGMNLAAVGEGYIIGLAGGEDGKDTWHAVSRDDIVNRGGKLTIDLGHGKRELVSGRDTIGRVWRPHPKKRAEADSSLRSSRVALRIIEMVTKYIFAQIDSRLYTGGVMVWPAGTSTTGVEGTTAEDIMEQFVELATEVAKDQGNPANLVPLVVEAPGEFMDKIRLIPMASELSKVAPEMIATAITRFAQAVDVQPEEITGLGGANHWSSWQLRQETVDAQVSPLLACVCDAIQRIWIGPALKAAGLDPDKFHIWYDTAPLTVRPQRLKDTLDLFAQGIVGAQAVLDAGAYLAGDAITDRESIMRFIRELVLRDPQLINNQAIRDLVGITKDMVPADAFAPPAAEAPALPPPPPTPELATQKHTVPEVPTTQGTQPKAVTASAAIIHARDEGVTIATAEAAVRRTMEIAGGRLLGPRERGQFHNTGRHQLHTVIPVDPTKVPKLMEGAGEHVFALAEINHISNPEGFTATVAGYCGMLLKSGKDHDSGRLRSVLQLGGLIGGPHAP